jgi:A/G-specific adenine glycosylase
VFLVQRARDARLMAGMWELPEVEGSAVDDGNKQIPRFARNDNNTFTLKHSITVTDYTVRVWHVAVPSHVEGKWIPVHRLKRVALTGLARKILRRAEIAGCLEGAEKRSLNAQGAKQ